MSQTNLSDCGKTLDARCVTWIAAAIAFLVAGVAGGGALHDARWAWLPPVVGFAAYVLAFREGLRGARPRGEGIDEAWRAAPSRSEGRPNRSWTFRRYQDRRHVSRTGAADRRWPAAVIRSTEKA